MLLVLIFLMVGLIGVAARPLGHFGDEDGGGGLSAVRVPPPTATPRLRPRTWTFFGGTVLTSGVLIGLQHPSPIAGCDIVVRDIVLAVTGSPTVALGYSRPVRPVVPFLGASYLLVLACVIRAGPERRVALAANAILFLALSAAAQALLIVLAVRTRWPIDPFGFELLLVDLSLGALVNARAIFATFILPRPTAVPRTRPRYPSDTLLALAALTVAACVVVLGFSYLASHPAGDLSRVLAPTYGFTIIFLFSPAALLPIGWLAPPRPQLRSDVAIDVITPAYNEAPGIEATLRSIDHAASVHGGPVRVVVSNDGSTDATETLARAAIGNFTAAEGEVISRPNGGKAVALNRALARTTADIVVRIDGDCVMGADALRYTSGWFDDPRIGSVGALMMPRRNHSSWFHRMRGLECLFQFGLSRRGQEIVDAMTVIPGTYVAFRREPAVAMGGFVDGMNGEDAELIMQLGRIGYRAALDPRIRCYEDVPTDVGAFLEQRTRWSRGGIQVAARHSPARSGSAGPRVWLSLVRRMFAWLSIMLGLTGPVYLGLLAALHPTYRHTVVTVRSVPWI